MPYYPVNSCLYDLVLFNNRHFNRELFLERGNGYNPGCYTKGDK